MDRNSLYLIVFALLIAITVFTFSALGEERLDLYISLFTLEYFSLTAIFRPRRRTFDFLGLALLLIFSYIVALRIIEVLTR